MKWVDKIYIISLKSYKNRRNTIKADLDSAGFDVSKIEWIDAVDGSKLDINECIKTNKISDTFIDPYGTLTKSIYGCSLSHQLVYQKLLETSDDVKTALVLEDDAGLTHTALRVLLSNSIYDRFVEEEKSIDWELILLGGQTKKMDYLKSYHRILKPIKRYPNQYAAHAYIINKSGAQKLIESNTPIRFAADVNLHCADVSMYCTPISYFSQKVGHMDRWTITDIQRLFRKMININEAWGTEVLSSTIFNDFDDNTDEDNVEEEFLQSAISNKLKVDSVRWDTFTAPNGDVLHNWTNIKLKTNE